jgi:hypothetical protein
MNRLRLQNSTTKFRLLLAVMLLLMVISCYLYYQNGNYEVQNRALIIKNDSLSGANIELSRSIQMRADERKDSLVTFRQPGE